MSSQPLDEDGFHSIAWDDAPPRPILTDVSSPLDDDNEGFETISAASPTSSSTPHASTSVPTRRDPATGTEVDPAEWEGRWMSIEVRDPVKEHEGSKDMYISYAVRTQVSRVCRLLHTQNMVHI